MEYKGRPLVRSGNLFYYGRMGDEYVLKMQVVASEKKFGVDVPTKVMLIESKTALEETNPMQAMTRNKMLDSLYEAMDYGNAWLSSHNL